MFNPTEVLIDAFGEELRAGYRRMYGGLKPDYEDIIYWSGGMSLENIANSDALYHNVEHTILVTLVGQEILRGKHMREGGVTPEDWLHFAISLACHDIGYVKGIQLKLDEIGSEHPEHADFVAQMRSLVDRFDLDQYMSTLKTLHAYEH